MVGPGDAKFEAAEVIRMFPTFVWKAELKPDVHERINGATVRTLDRIRRCLPALAPGQAWQSDQALHKLEDLRELVSCVNDTVTRVLEFIKISGDAFEITGFWANINATGSGHKIHSHPNNFLSGVYYVETHKGADTINFHDPRAQASIIRPPVTDLTAENTDQVVVKVKNGDLLVFPSWLPHSVDPNSSGKPRISISFNIMFSSFAERMSKPLW
ncbi:MAG: 2OG-Fe(II) oxygenase family protein [Alphaproteobacteria bacterium]|jgi:uncharacterized protein (TIGR02466 family)